MRGKRIPGCLRQRPSAGRRVCDEIARLVRGVHADLEQVLPAVGKVTDGGSQPVVRKEGVIRRLDEARPRRRSRTSSRKQRRSGARGARAAIGRIEDRGSWKVTKGTARSRRRNGQTGSAITDHDEPRARLRGPRGATVHTGPYYPRGSIAARSGS